MNKILLVFLIILISTFLIYSKSIIKGTEPKSTVTNKDSLLNLGIPERITDQYIKVLNFKKNKGRSFFVVDTKENLIFLFDKNGKFVAKSPTIDGYDRQKNSGKLRDFALKTYSEKIKGIGFVFDEKIKKVIDTTGKNRKLTNKLYFSYIKKSNTSFLPEGEYNICEISTCNDFVGGKNNTYSLKTLDNKEICKAIHGLYKSPYRIKIMKELVNLIQNDFTNPNVPKNYRASIIKNLDNNYYNNSFGCINVPEQFLTLSREHAMNAKIFVLNEYN